MIVVPHVYMKKEKNYVVHRGEKTGYVLIHDPGGAVLGMGCQKIKEQNGLAFKNLSHYDGGDFVPGVIEPAALTDEQKVFVLEENLRNFLLITTESAETATWWNKHLQALAEQSPLGVPVCISSDPRRPV